jgi:hypothetical protein
MFLDENEREVEARNLNPADEGSEGYLALPHLGETTIPKSICWLRGANPST